MPCFYVFKLKHGVSVAQDLEPIRSKKHVRLPDVKMTEIYTHVLQQNPAAVCSPLDALGL